MSPLQSISKVSTYALAFEDNGRSDLRRVGVEPKVERIVQRLRIYAGNPDLHVDGRPLALSKVSSAGRVTSAS